MGNEPLYCQRIFLFSAKKEKIPCKFPVYQGIGSERSYTSRLATPPTFPSSKDSAVRAPGVAHVAGFAWLSRPERPAWSSLKPRYRLFSLFGILWVHFRNQVKPSSWRYSAQSMGKSIPLVSFLTPRSTGRHPAMMLSVMSRGEKSQIHYTLTPVCALLKTKFWADAPLQQHSPTYPHLILIMNVEDYR